MTSWNWDPASYTLSQTGGAGRISIFGVGTTDVVAGLGENDFIQGRGGNDQLNGGEGNDEILGGAGNDRLEGGPGADLLAGGLGDDVYAIGAGERSASPGRRGRRRGSNGIGFLSARREYREADLRLGFGPET